MPGDVLASGIRGLTVYTHRKRAPPLYRPAARVCAHVHAESRPARTPIARDSLLLVLETRALVIGSERTTFTMARSDYCCT